MMWMAFLAVLAVAGLFGLFRLLRGLDKTVRGEPQPPFPSSDYHWPDILFGGALTAFFLFSIVVADPSAEVVNRQVLLNGSFFYFSLVVAILSFLILRGVSPVRIFGLQSSGWQGLLGFGFLVLLAAYPVIMALQMVSYSVFHAGAGAQPVVQFLVSSPGWLDRGAVILLAVVAAPVAEEVVFRGYLYGVARRYAGRWGALGASSLLFAAIHMHWPSMAGLFVLGLILALAYEKTRSLWVPIFMHSIFNGVSVVMTVLWPDLVP
jgi:membrane protease YdiL (CAAX protease family)